MVNNIEIPYSLVFLHVAIPVCLIYMIIMYMMASWYLYIR